MATLDAPAPVNLVKSIFLCNIFTFFFSATKACLLPFLTIYLKMLGLSATQTGLIMGAKTFVGLVFAPLWAKCSVRCGRRRCMMMFSLFVMGVTFLSLTAVPSLDENAFMSRCPSTGIPLLPTHPGNNSSGHDVATSKPVLNITTTMLTKSPDVTNATNIESTKGKLTSNSATLSSQSTVPEKLSTVLPSTTKTPATTKVATTTKPVLSSNVVKSSAAALTPVATLSSKDKNVEEILQEILLQIGIPPENLVNLSERDLIQYVSDLMNDNEGRALLSEALLNLPPADYKKLNDILQADTRRRRDTDENKTSNTKDDSSDMGKSKPLWSTEAFIARLKEFRDQIRSTENQMFIVVMIILMVGESLSCPIEKLADDGWFEFLESIDDIEKYGMHRIWSSFAYIIFPLIVTVSVDNTLCLFGLNQHPFMLHFYLFGGFLGITFLLAFCYPMVTSEKYRYANKVMKGLSVIGCNFRNLMMTITLLVLGTIYASYQNFLFWVLLDMGSQEVTMGLCLTLAAFSEIPMLLFNEKLVKKIGSGGVLCLSVLFLSARCLYYSYLPSPWAVLPAEITHAITHTAMWGAVLGTPAFNTSPALSRSIRSILSSVYFGVGYSLGSIVSGAVYDIYGSDILFQAGAVLAIGWFPILALSMRCCRERDRTDVKYQRLLTADDASDDSEDYEDDWLEKALKDK